MAHLVIFVSKLTYCLPLPDSPNLEGLLHMLAGLMQPLGVFKCEILVKKTNRKAKLLKEVVTPERTIFCLLNNNLLQPWIYDKMWLHGLIQCNFEWGWKTEKILHFCHFDTPLFWRRILKERDARERECEGRVSMRRRGDDGRHRKAYRV